jgi:hypothetical protein
MAEGISGHPILAYLTFVLPVVLLALGVLFNASVLLIIFAILWLATAFTVLYLPLTGDDGSKA